VTRRYVPASPRRALLVGPPGLTLDLVDTVLRRHGVTVNTEGPTDGPPDVAVLVDPRPDDWVARTAAPTVVVHHQDVESAAIDEVDLVLRGADAVVALEEATTHEVWEAVAAVAEGKTLLDPRRCRRLAEVARGLYRDHIAARLRLTGRELQVLAAIERGESVKQIAQALSLSTKTVEGIHTRLFRKLGARNRAQAVRRAHEVGLSSSGADIDRAPTTSQED